MKHYLLFCLIFPLFLVISACQTPIWYTRLPSSMLAYGPNDLVWNLNQNSQDLEETSKQIVLGILISNLANYDGNSDEIATKVLATPASEITKLEACLNHVNVDYFAHKKKHRTAVRAYWDKEMTCKYSNMPRSNTITFIPGQHNMPDMMSGRLNDNGLKLLVHGALRMLPKPRTIKLFGIDNKIKDTPIDNANTFLALLLLEQGFSINNEESADSLYCRLTENKLDPHSYHRIIYHLSCMIVSSDGKLEWQDDASLIPLLP